MKLVVNRAIDECLDEALQKDISASLFDSINVARKEKTISHTTLKETADVLNKSFYEIATCSSLQFDVPPPRKKSEKLVEILQKAQDIIHQREYDSMTRSVVHGDEKSKHQSMSLVHKDLKHAFYLYSSILNVLFSVAAVFTALFYVAPTMTDDVGLKTLIAFAGALIVAIAEGWFFSRDWLFAPEERL